MKQGIFSEKGNRVYISDREFESLPKELKECAKCHRALPLSEFNSSKVAKDGLYTWCKKCAKEYRRQYHVLNKERANKQARAWGGNHKQRCSELARTRRLRMYGLTDEDYKNMLESQNGKCSICGLPQMESTREFCVDHCHETNKVRGLLCFNCNTSLGKVKDSIPILISMIEYLERSQGERE